MSRIEIHIITYNEEIMLPFTIAHYRKMFGADVVIAVHDNNSTDNTQRIAYENKCLYIPFTTDGMNDNIHAHLKSQIAMNATSDWVLCLDADEECLINNSDLDELDAKGVNAVEFEGWNIFDEVPSPWDVKYPMGVPCAAYSKPVLLKTGVFDNVSFAVGAHTVVLTPKAGQQANWSKGEYKLLHYKHWSLEWVINRSVELASRQSIENTSRKFSYHFALPETVHRDHFNSNYEKRVPIIDSRLSE